MIADTNRPVVAVDVDGVLGEQATHLLVRAKKEYGVNMTKEQVTSGNRRSAISPSS